MHLNSVGSVHKPTKGRVQTTEWDEELESMSREKAAADANRGKSGWFLQRFHVANRMKLRETVYHRSEIKVSNKRSETTCEQVYSPDLTDSKQRQVPTTVE